MRVPMMSEGTRSGVNWIREKVPPATVASVSAASVLAMPGTPSSRQWPLASRPTIMRSTISSWPTMTRLISKSGRPVVAERAVPSVGRLLHVLDLRPARIGGGDAQHRLLLLRVVVGQGNAAGGQRRGGRERDQAECDELSTGLERHVAPFRLKGRRASRPLVLYDATHRRKPG